jgi:hypothetical protein
MDLDLESMASLIIIKAGSHIKMHILSKFIGEAGWAPTVDMNDQASNALVSS